MSGGRGRDGDAELARERARATSARRAVPWTAAGALGAGLLVAMAGGGWRGGLTLGGAGLLLVVFLLSLAVARCPACGRPLRRGGPGASAPAEDPPQAEDPARRGDRAGPSWSEGNRCPRCSAGPGGG